MTIEKARKILGEYANSMTDQRLLEVITCFNQIIEVGFQLFETKNSKNNFDKLGNKER